MKKKLFTAISAVLLTTTLLSACSQASQKLQFSPNWAQNTLGNTGAIEGVETLTYDVSFEKGSFLSKDSFSVEYCPNDTYGVFVTTLQASDEIDGYEYTTSLTIDVKFTMANGESETFTDSVTTKTVFKSSALALQPVRSEKTIISHTPRNTAATTLKESYVEYDYSITIDYDESCANGTATYTDNKGTLLPAETYPTQKTQTFEINTEKFTYLDNEQLLFAIRGLSASALATERKVNTYNVSTSAQEQVKIKPDTATSDKFSFLINGTALSAETVIEYIPVTISLNTINGGAPVYASYAKTTDPANNVYRNVLLNMETSVPYNIGTLNYQLKSAVFAK